MIKVGQGMETGVSLCIIKAEPVTCMHKPTGADCSGRQCQALVEPASENITMIYGVLLLKMTF